MFEKLLVANRGEIACRVIKTAHKLGLKTVAVFSEADKRALHVAMADEAVNVGPAPASQSYIAIDNILQAIDETGAQAVHPGYGFLSENSKFAQALEQAGVVFVGPPVRAIESMGDKITSKKIAQEAGVSTVPGYMDLIDNAEQAVTIANQIGYPVMIKASAGGGGKGMRIAWDDKQARESFQSSKNEAANSFGDDRIFIEKFITQPRHIEIQVLADTHGNCIYLGERECSVQRRNQKVVEEAPSPFLDPETRKAMGEQACALAKAVGYTNAGTVEFIVDRDRNFYFLEMNTRLQVEHPVTELITGLDLVEQMLRVANGELLSITQDKVNLTGWAIESRLYAEDPFREFLPSIGRLTRYRPPQETWTDKYVIRNDTGVYEGGEISIYYDPMIAKLCTWGPTRASAIDHMRDALDRFEVEGIAHNLPFLSAVMDHPKFIAGDITTAFIQEEFPEGFKGVSLSEAHLRKVVACCAVLHIRSEARRAQISGRLETRRRQLGKDWVVATQGQMWPLRIDIDQAGATLTFDDGAAHYVTGNWTPGDVLAEMTVDDTDIIFKVASLTEGFRVRLRGADLTVIVRGPRQAELSQLMPQKLPPDTSKMLLCPMPGLIVKIDVQVGDQVQEGQSLCTVEAMKMENILRSEKTTYVRKINVSAGDNLAVDDVIMEFGERDGPE